MTSEPDRTSPTPLFDAFVKEQVEKEQMAQAGITDSGSWHNGYRAACKDICERCGLDNTDEIELLVKERDALKANNEWMDKEFVRLNGELQAAQKDQELFRVFAEDVNDLRVAAHIKDLEIARLERNIASSDADAEKVGKIVRDQHQDITRLRAENAELRKDAARYRWLRDNKHIDNWWSVQGPKDKFKNIDADIDEAMGEERGGAGMNVEQQILDPCCGSRMFWFDRENKDVLFGDIRTEDHILCDGRTLNISPDMEIDFRDMPFNDGSFKLVVFDPPHLKRAGQDSWMGKKYGILSDNWKEDLKAGFSECFRVLKDDGVLIFKWAEVQIKVSEVLSLIEEKPLFGHKSGKRSGTHWICFMKQKEQS